MTHHTKATQDEESVHFYPEKELVELVHSLDREEDQHLFAQDVLISYPYLAEEYHKVCPHRMDLHSAAERASHGDYSYDAKLTELRHDIDLMVNNCVRFNGESHPLSEIAESFQFFAHEALDAYIASKTGGRRVSLLRLQLSQHSPTATTNINTNTFVNVDVHKTIKPVKPTTLPSCAELMEFISHTLVRREDANAFVEDVTVAYPSLKESYEAICPVKMNLMMMRERAQDGYYTYESIKDTESMCKEIEETITDKNKNNDNMNEENGNKGHKEAIQDAKEHENELSYKSVSKENSNSSKSSNDNKNKSKKESSQASSGKEKNLNNKTNILYKSVNEEMYKEWRMHKVFGTSVATSLRRLREDLELIVDNCIRFNINVEAWVKLALSFRKFAHRKVDELVLRHAPVLKGTATGVEVYVKQIHPLQQQQLEKSQTTPINALQTMSSNIHQDSVLFSAQKAANAEVQEQEEEEKFITAGQTKENTAEVKHNAQNNFNLISPSLEQTEEDQKGIKKEQEHIIQDDKSNLKRPRDEREEPNFTADKMNNTTMKCINYGNSNSATVKSHKPNSTPSVHVVHMTTPHITPSALQPEVHIPASLRMQIEHDYVKRDTIRLRRIGSMLPLTKELVSLSNINDMENKHYENESTRNSTNEANNVTTNDDQNALAATNSKEETITNITTNNNNDSSKIEKKEVVVTAQMTSAFVLHLFMNSVHDYYHHRRTEPSFNTAFDYSAQDEQLYDDVIHVLATQFDQLFTSLLLYPLELADAHAWQAVQL